MTGSCCVKVRNFDLGVFFGIAMAYAVLGVVATGWVGGGAMLAPIALGVGAGDAIVLAWVPVGAGGATSSIFSKLTSVSGC